jgi:hypothetical protein
MAMRHLWAQPLADPCTTIEPCHLRRHCGLIDEDETRGFQPGLLGPQLRSRGRDIRPILLGRVQDFLLNVISCRS